MSIKLIKETRKEMTVYSFEKNGKTCIIKGIYHKSKFSSERNELAKILKQLRNNGFIYFKEYGNYKVNTIEQLYKLLELTHRGNRDRFLYKCLEFTDCYGRIEEVGENFFFRIYDKTIVEKIEQILKIEIKKK